MKQLVITLLGVDRPGIVDKVSDLVLHHGGNWQASSMRHLAGLFAGILEVTIADDQVDALKSELSKLTSLQVQVADGITTEKQEKRIQVMVTANDRPGIVQDISKTVSGLGANVLVLETRYESAPNWGQPLFKADTLVSLPAGLDEEQLTDALEAIADDLMVDIESS
ncbi:MULTISPECIES: glycine cleavage system protein R [Corallincola]|uniref:Glycine cleavage system transcriptional repressor n=3 Tax=Corallincola TaxID=1775176 RepID=A0A368NHI2_9GAMM|nr:MULTISPECIES: ACT domain-containing protein [Corallincola]RCU49094.1 glycine cleavage system protein R [Corallincola holothuriorum]TAA47594.1 glycine cleavage system protein R [Corallincola spongiicola]TCI05276.1 glycine cleavage system protein R [Corallincola luteus]